MEHRNDSTDLDARLRRLSVYNGEKSVLDKDNMPATGFCDEIDPADETLESMAQAAAASHHDDDAEEDEGEEAGSLSTSMLSTTEAGEQKKKKKSKSRKPKSKRGIGKPTGFEEYFADGPLTPAQYAKDLEDFSPDLPFIDRILLAVRRFEQSKRMVSERRDVFYKYLAYGGVDVGPNMFQGDVDLEGLDKESTRIVLSQASIAKEKHNVGTPDAECIVDFSGCVGGFLSRRAMSYYGFETHAQVEMVTSTLEKWMNFLLHHNVCPEYSEDIREARRITQIATKELNAIAQISVRLPGDFNVAASTLFGGIFSTRYHGVSSWDRGSGCIGLTRQVASEIFCRTMATIGTDKQCNDSVAGTATHEYDIEKVKERAGFEITDIISASEMSLDYYERDYDHYRPVGFVYARPWHNKASEGLQDLTPAERAEQERAKAHSPVSPSLTPSEEIYTFVFEDAIQEYLFVGLKIEATLYKLRCGIWFMDDFLQAFCSFDTWLCNELMVGYKKPRILKGAVCYRGEGMGEEAEDDEGEGEGEGVTETDGL